jgi:hypothetical protein
MKRFSLILASLVLIFGSKASAFSGGPFDNGDYSTLLDENGIYQVAFRFSNGSGFAQFGNNVNQELFLPVTTGTGVSSTTFSVLNRSILYYKGVTYLGTCFGMVDHERKTVSGVTNGQSDITTSQTTTGGGGPTITSTNTLIFNGGLGFTANTEFICKIKNTYPILRFNGKGELTIVNPSLASNIASQVALAIAGQAPLPAVKPPPSTVGQIQNFITALDSLATGAAPLIPSATQVDKNAEHIKLIAFGSRIYMNKFR